MFISISRERIRWQWQGWRAFFQLFHWERDPYHVPYKGGRTYDVEDLMPYMSPETQEAFERLGKAWLEANKQSKFTTQQLLDALWWIRR